MTEKISLRIFLTCMVLCATTVLLILWLTDEPSEAQAKTAVSLFVIGFASFLIWATTIVKKFLRIIADKG